MKRIQKRIAHWGEEAHAIASQLHNPENGVHAKLHREAQMDEQGLKAYSIEVVINIPEPADVVNSLKASGVWK